MNFAFWRRKDEQVERLIATLDLVIKNQQQMTTTVMNTVQAFSEVASKQADVLNKYLDLFKTPGEPQRWTDEYDEEAKKQELAVKGFPHGGSEAEQAQWVLDHLGDV
jgi:hypothetical protein